MLHTAKIALALGTLACFLPAQTFNRDLYWPNEPASTTVFPWPNVSAATRVGGLNTAAVEVLQDRSALLARGLGSDASTPAKCELAGMMYVVQDQDRTTANTFAIVARAATAADGPADTSGYIFSTANLSTPSGTATGGVAWGFTSTFAAPLPTLPCENGYYLGLRLDPQISATDFTLAWTASAFGTTAGTNPRVPTPKWHCGRVDGTPFVFTRTTSSRTLAINGLFAKPTINVANVDAASGNYIDYSLGGSYPDCTGAVTPTDGLELRVQDESNLGGVGALLLSTGYFPGGFPVGGIDGALWLNIGGLTQIGAPFNLPTATPAVVKTVVAPPGLIPATTGVQLTFQAFTASSSFTNGRLTNAVSTNL